MKVYSKDELREILDEHKKWLTISQAEYKRADLSYTDLSDADLSYTDLRNADLSGANLRNADLSGADLSSANLRNADLRNADLRNADLSGANLRNADLSSAYLSSADLSYADLSYTDLRNADLSGANLRNADLSGADLSSANLRNADLRNADLSGANLSGANGLVKRMGVHQGNCYFKRISDDLINQGYQFKVGLNVLRDGELFASDERVLCSYPGFHFASKSWCDLNYGGRRYEALIRIPEGAKINEPWATDGKASADKIEIVKIIDTTTNEDVTEKFR